MLERIGQEKFESLSAPSVDAIFLTYEVLRQNTKPVIAEIGVGIGATTLELAKLLANRGELYIFDYSSTVNELTADLTERGFTNIRAFGSARLLYDSYVWHLLKLLRFHRKRSPNGIFDFAYLDGAHTFTHDIGAAVLLKLLVKPGGYLLLDDLHWSFLKSPTMNPESKPEVLRWYSAEQLEVSHIQLICDAVLESDPAFERLAFDGRISKGRALYRRLV